MSKTFSDKFDELVSQIEIIRHSPLGTVPTHITMRLPSASREKQDRDEEPEPCLPPLEGQLIHVCDFEF